MSEPIHELPESIELTREEYRSQHAALEAALDLLDRFPDATRAALFVATSSRRFESCAAHLAVPR
jgi:hypothetical protein